MFFRIIRRYYRRKRRPNSVASKKEYAKHVDQARVIVKDKLETWQKFYLENFQIEFKWNRVVIKNSKTRWGSCSSKKNLNFSYKIVFLNEEERDYLIIHELCHLQQMNHGQDFWKLVSLGCPNFLVLRHKLRRWKMGEN
jgi:predicted metal-dependent hydrolase